MARAAASAEIERLIQLLARLPGLGPRSARRAALHLVKKKEQLLGPLALALTEARDSIVTCETCGNIDTITPCTLCRDPTRDPLTDPFGEDTIVPTGIARLARQLQTGPCATFAASKT